MPMRDPDENLLVVFKTTALKNDAKSLEAGRLICDDVEICEVKIPGMRDVKHFRANVVSHWVTDPYTGEQKQVTYAERFSHQYRQFKQNLTQTKSGTPLEELRTLSEGRRAELRALSVYTVEQLAEIEGAELKNLGPGGREMKNAAMDFIEEAKASVPNKRMQAELEALRARNALLEDDVAQMKARTNISEGEFAGMTDDELRDYITAQTGSAPHGTLPRKSLLRMAESTKGRAA